MRSKGRIAMSPEFSFVNVWQAAFQLHPSRYSYTFALEIYRLRWVPSNA